MEANLQHMVVEVPYLFARKRMSMQNPPQSWVSLTLQDSEDDGKAKSDKELRELDEVVKYTAGIMFAGGADTVSSTLGNFLLAMINFPEVQKRAQQEIDGVTGADRLPCFEDRSKMPYTEGVVKEALRWLPVAPVGTTHMASEDVGYGGYDIPN